jgi:hypothetical protein
MSATLPSVAMAERDDPEDIDFPEDIDDPPRDDGAARGIPGAGRPGGAIGAAIGTAMLGLEQALRREPPAEVVVRAHQPVRGLAGRDGELVIHFPDDLEVG